MKDYQILYIANGLMFSKRMTKAEAKAYILAHPDFPYNRHGEQVR